MGKIGGTLVLLLAIVASGAAQVASVAQRVDSVLALMTLEEKIGQMNQYSADFPTGPIRPKGDVQEQIIQGKIGSFLNASGAVRTRELQQLALQSRLKIPLLFGQDVLHGYRTVLPIPLAEAASWDMPAIEKSARIAAEESSAVGLHWVFAPMVDITRDPRWGRVMEGAGEDPFLGAQVARARVRGFQGAGPGATDAVMACVKHFAAYGAAEGGRDYNSVDLSNRRLFELYLPPFEAAVDAGVATVMNSFNDLNGVPATASTLLQRDILKKRWGFKGIVVSDWGSVGEMVAHGYAADSKEAARLAVNAGCDMDMESRAYLQHLAELQKSGQVKMEVIDDAVRRILTKKFEMGLFDDPFRFCSEQREKEQWDRPEHSRHAREMAQKSIVLLKNEGNLLPLKHSNTTIALIGPIVKSKTEHLGFWSYDWPDDSIRLVSLWDGMRNKLPADARLLYAKGCDIQGDSQAGFPEAVAIAQQADVVVVNVGEERAMTGEARSRSDIHLPGQQEALVQALIATGKPVVVLISAGRPLTFNWIGEHAPAILYTWWLGKEAGNAIADVLFGDYNPSGKLPISFPRSVGQIPIYYNHLNTGRPAKDDNERFYVSAYNDLPNSPAYPFGFGLSYTRFQYGPLQVSRNLLHETDALLISMELLNEGKYAGEEVVQLYLRDVSAGLARPVKELKGFRKIALKAGEKQLVTFTLRSSDLGFYTNDMEKIWEPGDFEIMVGPNSRDVQTKTVRWER